MDLYQTNVSDEALFLKMTQGDRHAEAILFHRYQHTGIMYFYNQIRITDLHNYKESDFIEVIDDAIYKAFRYYHFCESKFYSFCLTLLKQNITRAINNLYEENIRNCNAISLDTFLTNDASTNYHEVIADNGHLPIAEECHLKNILELIAKEDRPKMVKNLTIYALHKTGLTIEEISKKLNISIYEIRNVLEIVDKIINEKYKSYLLN